MSDARSMPPTPSTPPTDPAGGDGTAAQQAESLAAAAAESDVAWADPEVWKQHFVIRTFEERDAEACRDLYTAGLLGGQIAGNDTGLDIDDIPAAYLENPLNHFWVCEATSGPHRGQVVGMIGVQHHDEGVGEIRRLRVRQDQQRRRVGTRLLERAIRFCRDTECLKVALDTFVSREPAIDLFKKFKFRHGRTRQVNGKDMLYFYLDLYTQDRDNKRD